MTQALLCPACDTPHGPTERFCPDCGLPLVLPPEERAPLTAAQERARKVRASYAEGPLVRIAAARNQPERSDEKAAADLSSVRSVSMTPSLDGLAPVS